MTQLSALLDEKGTALLDAISPTTTTTEVKTIDTSAPPILTERIIDAYACALAYAEQIVDPEYKKNTEDKLVRSNVRGSLVVGIRGTEDVEGMLNQVKNWQEVTANLKDKSIICFQGELSDKYPAYAAYASVREIAHKFGTPGLSTVQAKLGYQHHDDYYFCTVQRFPTNILTVQLKKDASEVEHLHQWFAGPEISSRGHFNDGDTIVRCGVILPLMVPDQNKGKQNGYIQGNRNRRVD